MKSNLDIMMEVNNMEKIICTNCGKPENKKATMDNVCATCWNRKSKLVRVK
jgi:NMD protein affecting ribosome stability and mRNA decay